MVRPVAALLPVCALLGVKAAPVADEIKELPVRPICVYPECVTDTAVQVEYGCVAATHGSS